MADDLLKLKSNLRSLRNHAVFEVHERVDLRAWTALRVGGTADLVVRCHSLDALQQVVDLLASHGQRWFVLGTGSSVVPSDHGLRCPVLTLGGELALWSVEGNDVTAGAGANMTQLCRAMAQFRLLGKQQARGSAVSLGAELIPDQRLPPSPFPEFADWIEVVQPGVATVQIGGDGRARSVWPTIDWDRKIIARARLRFTAGKRSRSERRGTRLFKRPWRKVEGIVESVFRDPGELSADDLLDKVAAAGDSSGGAEVPESAANSIVTSRRCTAADVISLCRMMRERVRDSFGVEMQTRLRLIDEYGRDVPL